MTMVTIRTMAKLQRLLFLLIFLLRTLFSVSLPMICCLFEVINCLSIYGLLFFGTVCTKKIHKKNMKNAVFVFLNVAFPFN